MLLLALNGDQWIALAGVVVGAVVGVLIGGAGLVFAYVNGNREREHGAQLARTGRLHAQRRDAYTRIAGFLELQRLYVSRIEQRLFATPPAPEIDDSEWASVTGLAAVLPSEAVVTALETSKAAIQSFQGKVWGLRLMTDEVVQLQRDEADRSTISDAHIKRTEADREMEEARDDARRTINEAERAMREELAEL